MNHNKAFFEGQPPEPQRMEKQLALLHLVLDQVREGMILTDDTGRFRHVNTEACCILGYTREELLQLGVSDVNPDFSLTKWSEHWSQIKTQGSQTFESRHKAKDGRVFPIEVNASYFEHEGQSYNLAVVRDITERKLTERQVSLLNRALDQVHEGAFLADETGRFRYVNAEACRALGYPREELLQLGVLDIDPDFSPAKWSEHWSQIITQGSRIFESRHRAKDGRVFPIEVSVSLFEHEGQSYNLALVRDITERQRAERELLMLNSALNTSSDAVFLINEQRRFIYVNDAACRSLGYRREELLNLTPSDIDPDVNPERGRAIWKELLATGHLGPFESRHRRRDGSIFPVELVFTVFRHAGEPFNLAVVRNITERKRVERELLLLSSAINESDDALFLINDQYRFVYVNDAACRSLGYSREELLKMGPLDIDPKLDRETADKIWQHMISVGHLASFETVHRARDGRVFPIEMTGTLFRHGGEMFSLAITRNITERKQAEGELRRLNRELRAVSSCNQTLLRAVDEPSLLNDICRIICDEAGYRMAWAGYAEHDEAKTVRPVAWAGAEAGYLATANITWADTERGRGPAGTAIHTGETVHVQDFATDARMTPWRENVLKRGYRACVALPLMDREKKVFGVLLIYSAEASAISPDELRLLEELAGDLAFGITFLRTQRQHEQAEKALQRSEQNYREIFNATNEAIFMHDAVTGQVLDVNDTMLHMFGFDSKAEALSGGVNLTVSNEPPYTMQEALRRIRLAIEQGPQVFEWLARRKNGTCFWAEVSLQSSQVGGQGRVLAVVRDIAARKTAEEERIRLSTALDQTAESVVITDPAGMILYVNPAFERHTGYLRREVIGQNTRILKSGKHDAAFYQRMWATLARGEVWQGRLINKRKDGRLYEEEATISPIRDAAGKIVNYMAIKLDVTREMELESQFRQVQKLESIGQLAGGVAHDFNNILAGILMQVELLSMSENRTDEDREGLAQIRADAERAANLTRQLLLFSRKQVMQPRNLDLNEVVTGLAKMLLRIIGEDVQLQLNLHSTPLMIHADAGMLDQVLMNLVVNARDALPEGGHIFVETSEKIVDEALARTQPDVMPGHFVCLSVRDTGSGIPPEILPRIFEPFFTTKEAGKGTGLGLATVFGIVKQHRGWLTVSSEPGQGTTFQVYLPAIIVAPAAPAAAPAKPRGGTETILLAEDEESVRHTMRTILERSGYIVLAAASGAEALKIWEAQNARIALLLSDLVMPAGISGQQLARKIQAERPALKVIYITGYSAEIAGQAIELRSSENFLQKPFHPHQLLETVRRCLDKQ